MGQKELPPGWFCVKGERLPEKGVYLPAFATKWEQTALYATTGGVKENKKSGL
jgi:hypothetical protein